MGFSSLGTSEKAPEFNLARKFAGLIAYLQAQLTSHLLDDQSNQVTHGHKLPTLLFLAMFLTPFLLLITNVTPICPF